MNLGNNIDSYGHFRFNNNNSVKIDAMFPESKSSTTAQVNSVDSFDDEFSDFQSAVVLPKDATQMPRQPATAVGVYSNVHISVPKPFESNILPSFPAAPTKATSGGQKQNTVGYRLAHYDVGMSTASPQLNPASRNPAPELPRSKPVGQTYSNGDSLLIGEEDRYSALRDLMIDSSESPASVFASDVDPLSKSKSPHPLPTVSHFDGNVEHQISLVGDDVLEIIKTESLDSSEDMNFGDFQSFMNTTPQTNSFVPAQNLCSEIPGGSNSHSSNGFEASFNNVTLSNVIGLKQISNSPEYQSTPIANSVSNPEALESDSEFGDFVSCPAVTLPPPPTSPKISLFKTESHKKSTNSTTSKTRKGSQNVSKLNASTIVKASNLLSESPTYPRKSFDSSPVINDGFASVDIMAASPGNGFAQSGNILDDLVGLDFNPTAASIGASSVFESKDSSLNFEANLPIKTKAVTGISFEDEFEEFSKADSAASDTTILGGLELLPSNKQAISLAETQSISSLDLGNYLESGENKVIPESDISPEGLSIIGVDASPKPSSKNLQGSRVLHPAFETETYGELHLSPERRSSSSTRDSPEDKYQVFKDEIDNERERCTLEWCKCLSRCLDILSRAQGILMSVSSSGVVREVLSNEKGYNYALNLIEVCLVANRIRLAWQKLGGGARISEIFDEISSVWELLVQFFIGTPLAEQIENMHGTDDEIDYTDPSKICGVCLINAKVEKSESLIDYGGKYYHAACANLWINEVDSILPSLYCVNFPSVT